MVRMRFDYSTQMCEDRFERISRIGLLKSITGYRYFGRYHTFHEAVMIRGDKGSIRFGGLLWGYSGQGPRGLKNLLTNLFGNHPWIDDIVYNTKRKNSLKKKDVSWKISLENRVIDTITIY